MEEKIKLFPKGKARTGQEYSCTCTLLICCSCVASLDGHCASVKEVILITLL